MFVGHYGVSFAAKKAEPDIPLWLLFMVVQLLDVVWAPLVLLGVVSFRDVRPDATARGARRACPHPPARRLTGAREHLPNPDTFESGTPNITSAVGLAAAVDYVTRIPGRHRAAPGSEDTLLAEHAGARKDIVISQDGVDLVRCQQVTRIPRRDHRTVVVAAPSRPPGLALAP